ncbi:hypothetical protein AX15_002606 [Amanita polypyramis BW_CC]|nr:hypothetical protein AX15_002606 [Amanita polypyramis BW_CC]
MDPSQLVQQFKKSGEFDRLRRHLLSQFQRSDGITTFKSKVEDIVRQRFTSDDKLQQLPPDVVHKELMQELDRQVPSSFYLVSALSSCRYPIVERAAADICTLSDTPFADEVRSSMQRILQASMPDPTGIGNMQAPPATVDLNAAQRPDASSAEPQS